MPRVAEIRHEVGTGTAHIGRYVVLMTTTTTPPVCSSVSTPWGRAQSLERVNIAQRAGERQFETIVELLETADGERLVRFAYATGGSARRGPVTLRARDVKKLLALLERTPELRAALGRLNEPAGR